MQFNIKINQSSATDIRNHLGLCDERFIPRLSSRVDMLEYAQKLASLAVRLEAWESTELIGLLAVYCNDQVMRVAHITSVSVVPMRANNGVGSALIHHCIAYITGLKMYSITLDVAQQNVNAIKLYQRHGFVGAATNAHDTSMIMMRLILKS